MLQVPMTQRYSLRIKKRIKESTSWNFHLIRPITRRIEYLWKHTFVVSSLSECKRPEKVQAPADMRLVFSLRVTQANRIRNPCKFILLRSYLRCTFMRCSVGTKEKWVSMRRKPTSRRQLSSACILRGCSATKHTCCYVIAPRGVRKTNDGKRNNQ